MFSAGTGAFTNASASQYFATASGSASAPGYAFSSALTTGIYSSAGMQFTVANSNVGAITATGLNGMVIGATTPTTGTFTSVGFTTLTQTNGATITDPGTGGLLFSASGTTQNIVFTPTSGGYNKFNVSSFFNGPIGLLNAAVTGQAFTLNGDPGNNSGNTTGIENEITATSANITGAVIAYDSYFVLSGSSLVPLVVGYNANGGALGSASLTSYRGFSANQHPTATNAYAYWSQNFNSGTGVWQLYMGGTADSYLNGNLLLKTTTDSSNGVIQLASSTSASAGIVFGNDSPQASIYRSAASTLTTPAIWNVSNTTAATTGGAGALTVAGGIYAAGNIVANAAYNDKLTTLTYASPTSVTVTSGNVFETTTVNATGSVTFNASGAGTAGQHMEIIIINDATSGKVITFGSNFRSSGTLTGVPSKASTIKFVSDGTSWFEVARTVGTL